MLFSQLPMLAHILNGKQFHVNDEITTIPTSINFTSNMSVNLYQFNEKCVFIFYLTF